MRAREAGEGRRVAWTSFWSGRPGAAEHVGRVVARGPRGADARRLLPEGIPGGALAARTVKRSPCLDCAEDGGDRVLVRGEGTDVGRFYAPPACRLRPA